MPIQKDFGVAPGKERCAQSADPHGSCSCSSIRSIRRIRDNPSVLDLSRRLPTQLPSPPETTDAAPLAIDRLSRTAADGARVAATREPRRFRIVDASGPMEEIQRNVLAIVTDLLEIG